MREYIEMVIDFEFAAAFATALGVKSVIVTLQSSSTTLGEAIAAMFESYPDYQEKFKKNRLLRDGNFVAMFISDSTILTTDSILLDGSHIKVLSPILGG